MSYRSRSQNVSFTPGFRTFLTKAMTPIVLVLGVLLLVYFNFNSVLKAAQVTDDHFHGNVAFSQGPFDYRFQEQAGLDRPALSYAEQDLISYSEWGSTSSVDGNVQELWNTFHGYDYDEAKRQMYSTMSGNGWQLIEIVTLVNDHTVTVTFNFDELVTSLPGPSLYVFDIAHVTSSAYQWYNSEIKGNTFTGQVMGGNGTQALLNKPKFFGLLSLTIAGGSVRTPAIWMKNATTIANGQKNITLAQEFFTEYQVSKPSPGQMITLGTETLTFQSSKTSPDAPLPLPAQGQ